MYIRRSMHRYRRFLQELQSEACSLRLLLMPVPLLTRELFEDISYIMAKHVDPQNVPDTPDEWLDQFGTFSIYQVLPEIIELWGLNVQTQVESKKTSSD